MLATGIIVMWYGNPGNIPAGWTYCNGDNGTPDLRNRFIVGSGLDYPAGGTGGSLAHDHDFTGSGHTHEVPGGTAIDVGVIFSRATDIGIVNGTTDEESTLPLYHALVFIMKT